MRGRPSGPALHAEAYSVGLPPCSRPRVFEARMWLAAIMRTRLGYFDRSIEEAAQDLGASRPATFFLVTLRVILPGIVASALIAFTLSLDEFIIVFFTAGPTVVTFPIRIYSMIRFGVTPGERSRVEPRLGGQAEPQR